MAKKPVKQKNKFEDILNSYQDSFGEINNIKDLFSLASQEKNEEIIEDCNLKIEYLKVGLKSR